MYLFVLRQHVTGKLLMVDFEKSFDDVAGSFFG